ncbi:MAG TPA: hypothetical protein VMU84_07040 [Thermoanaerobaculia bacterium]|nr:hypothetical protein [Thermoanaerobaculia bacterium]
MHGWIRFPSGFHAVTDESGERVLVNFAQVRYVRPSGDGAKLEFSDGVDMPVRESFQRVSEMLERPSGVQLKEVP